MPIKFISITILAILTFVSQNLVLADNKISNDFINHSQSMFCAETTGDENKETETKEEEEEPDCD